MKNTPQGLAELAAWCVKNGAPISQTHAIMEGTGVYHSIAAETLTKTGMKVSVVNPAQVKHFGKGLGVKTKTDSMDSFVLARYGKVQNPEIWQPPPKNVRTLQLLMRRLDAVSQDVQREYNRQEKIKFSGKVPPIVLASIEKSIAFHTEEQNALRKEIEAHINNDPDLKKDVKLLRTIPGVGEIVGATMVVMLREHDFRSAEQAAAYLGVVPVERQSGTSVHGRAKMSKSGPPKVRALLYLAGMVGIRHNPHCKQTYERLIAKGKTKMTALGAVMRKLVHLCYGVLKHQKPYDSAYVGV